MPPERLGEYRHSSYWYLTRPKQRPGFLRVETALTEAGRLADQPAGWKSYADYLTWQASEGPAGNSKAYVSLSKGWALGSEEFKTALRKDHVLVADRRTWDNRGAREIREAQWSEILARGMRFLGKTPATTKTDRKSAPWKVALAGWMKQNTPVTNRWLCEQLHMGTPVSVADQKGSGFNVFSLLMTARCHGTIIRGQALMF